MPTTPLEDAIAAVIAPYDEDATNHAATGSSAMTIPASAPAITNISDTNSAATSTFCDDRSLSNCSAMSARIP